MYLNIPNPCCDGPLVSDDAWDRMYLDPYLRVCFQWGGFPSLQLDPAAAERAQNVLAFLTNDLLLI